MLLEGRSEYGFMAFRRTPVVYAFPGNFMLNQAFSNKSPKPGGPSRVSEVPDADGVGYEDTGVDEKRR
jgi:hypothetical protein